MIRLLPLALVLALLCSTAQAVVQGMPLMQHYTSRDYHANAANIALLAGPDGTLYAGNERGLLRFDGSHWDRLDMPGRGSARSMAFDREGRLHVGTYDRLGRIDIDDTGLMRFVDLRERLPGGPDAPALGVVWSIIPAPEGLYIYADGGLILLAYDGKDRRWALTPDVRAPFAIDRGIHARIQGIGLTRLEGDAFVPVPGGEVFAEGPLFHLFDTEAGALAIGEQGFFRLGAEGLVRVAAADNDWFGRFPPYSGIQLEDGGFIFGTYGGELLHFSAELKLVALHDIAPYTVFDLALDREGGLWAATEGNLIRLRYPSPWSLHDAGSGLVSRATDSVVYRGKLYVGTSLGVLRAHAVEGATRFEPAIATELEANALYADDDAMLVADRFGVLRYVDEETSPERVLEADTPSYLMPSLAVPDRLFVPANDGLDLLRKRDGRWRHEVAIEIGEVSITGMEETRAGELWLGDSRGGPLRMRFAEDGEVIERRVFGSADGLTLDPEFGSYVEALDDRIYVISGKRVHRLDGDRFSVVDEVPFNRFAEPFDIGISETPHGVFAYSRDQLLQRAPGSDEWLPALPGAALSGGFWGADVDADGMLRVLSWDGLLQYDPRQRDVVLPPPSVLLRSATLRKPDGSLQRLPLRPSGGVQALPSREVAQFDFSIPTMEPGTQYRLRIAGMFDEWSAWTPMTSPGLNLRTPGPGDYLLEVEGRTPSGRIAEPLKYRFSVAPEWWQTNWARAGAGGLGIALIIGVTAMFSRWRYRRVVALNRSLESRIAERTLALETANRKLAELATEDELTGVANRRALEQAMAREWERCRDLGQPLAVLIVDVDHFKQYNDRHGHLAGDRHLVQVADALRRHVRPVRELLARFGGEEFVLVMPGATLVQAGQRGETIRAGVERDTGGTTISVGVAVATPDGPDRDQTALLQRADGALYRAKAGGRNRVELDP